jgi:hypothetical protein
MRRLGVATVAAVAMLGGSGLVHARLAAASTAPWLARSNSACQEATRERAAVLGDVSRLPSKTARQTLLRILRGTARAETRLLDRLNGVRVPRANAAAFTEATDVLRRRHAEDVQLIASLERHWNVRLLERQTRRDHVANTRLERLWTRLGAASCSHYFHTLRG